MASKISYKLLSSWTGKHKDAADKGLSKQSVPVDTETGKRSTPGRTIALYKSIRRIFESNSDSSIGSTSSSTEEFEDGTESDRDSLYGAVDNASSFSSSLFHRVSTRSSSSANTTAEKASTSSSSRHVPSCAISGADHLIGFTSDSMSNFRRQPYEGSSSGKRLNEINQSPTSQIVEPSFGTSDSGSPLTHSFREERSKSTERATGLAEQISANCPSDYPSRGRSESCEGSSHGLGCVEVYGIADRFTTPKEQPFNFSNDDGSSTGLDDQQPDADILHVKIRALLQLESDVKFWQIAISNEALIKFLRSYVHFRKRWYDVPSSNVSKRIDTRIFKDGDLNRLIIMVLYRLSLKEEGFVPINTCYTKLLNIPTVMDICSLYGRDHPELTSSLVCNVIKSGPKTKYEENLVHIGLQVINKLRQMECRAMTAIKVIFNSCKLEPSASTSLSNELFEVTDYFHDVIATVDYFLEAYSPAAKMLTSANSKRNPPGGLLSFVASLHDTFAPLLQEGLTIITGWRETFSQASLDGRQIDQEWEHVLTNTQLQLTRLRVRLVKFAWQLISTTYLQVKDEKIFYELDENTARQAFHGEKHPDKRGEELLQALSTIAKGSTSETPNSFSGKSIITGSLLYSIQARNHLDVKVARLLETGYIFLDPSQQGYLLSLLTSEISSARAPIAITRSSSSSANSSDSQHFIPKYAVIRNDEQTDSVFINDSNANRIHKNSGFDKEVAVACCKNQEQYLAPFAAVEREDEKEKQLQVTKHHISETKPQNLLATSSRPRWRNNLIYEDSEVDVCKEMQRTGRSTQSIHDEKLDCQISKRAQTQCVRKAVVKGQKLSCKGTTQKRHSSLCHKARATSSNTSSAKA